MASYRQPRTIRVMSILEAYSVTGPAKAVLEFASEANRPGAQVLIDLSLLTFLRDSKANDFTRIAGERGIPLDVVNEKGKFDFRVLPQLAAAIDRRQPDIIWTNSVKSHFLVRWARLNRRAKWVAFHHGYTTTDWKTRLYNQLDRWSLPAAKHLVTVCGKFATDLEKHIGVPASDITVEHMPLRPAGPIPAAESAATRRALGLSDAPVLLSVGRLSREKGHAELLRALSRLDASGKRKVQLLLAGDGPERRALEQFCSKLGLEDSVRFLGHQGNVRPLYGVADLFVLPSHSEGSPNVLLEAIDADVPIVATAVGGIPEIVEDGISALLVGRMDEDAMVVAINRLLGDRKLRDQLRTNARLVLAKHTPERYFGRISGVFQQVLES
jgi:glycosyltransferase involved in cell wall biosynthesis